MSTFALLRLGGKQSWRERRAFTVLFFAVLVAVASSSSVSFFSERLHLAMAEQASEFLGADIALQGSVKATEEQLTLVTQQGLTGTRTVEFSTMLAHKEHMLLSQVKAVEPHYPLKGQLRIQHEATGPEVTTQAPAPGEIWLEARIFNELELSPGDSIKVGSAQLQASAILTHEPAQASAGMMALQPLALMNLEDLPATRAIQPGSRITYRYLWQGPEAAVTKVKQLLPPLLTPQQRLVVLEEASPPLHRALKQAQQYLGLTSLVAILLAAVGIALSATHFTQSRLPQAALWRCFGLSQRQTLTLFAWQFLIIGGVASLLGAGLGWLAQQGLFYLLRHWMPATLPPPSLFTALGAMGVGCALLLCFSLPQLMTLSRVPPMRVLREQLQPIPTQAWLGYALGVFSLMLAMWQLSLSLSFTMMFALSTLGVALLLGGALYYLLIRCHHTLHQYLFWRLSLGQLIQKPLLAVSQLLAFTLILVAMSLVLLLRNELIDQWQQQLPEDAPNHFAFNIFPHEVEPFHQALQNISPNISQFYPITPGRLTHINQVPVNAWEHKTPAAERTLQRDLQLTWSATLPSGNRLVAGDWWANSPDIAPVSVEDKLAERLGLSLGDVLEFNLGGQVIKAQVANLRSVDWAQMQPNFFIIFAPGWIEHLPHTWLVSFYVPEASGQMLSTLREQFPAASLLNVNAVLSQLQQVVKQVGLAVESLLFFVLAAGLMVLLAGIQTTLPSRVHQSALLRALGAQSGLIRRLHFLEFALLGAISGTLAWGATELTSAVLYHWVFSLTWKPHFGLASLPLIGMLLIYGVGYFGTRHLVHTSPLTLLRRPT